MSAVLDPSTSTELAQPRDTAVMPGFNSNGSWELIQRVSKAFASSDLVPKQYQGNLANCMIAMDMAQRIGANPLRVMQNLYIVHGNPGWSSKFLIASFNQSGKFSAMRYEWNEARTECRAWATEKATGERLVGPLVSIAMAKDEGWSTKSGSKWKTMPELMLMYRAAAFFVRTYAPEISMGLRTDDELVDTVEEVRSTPSINAVRAALTQTQPATIDAPALTLADYTERVDQAASREDADAIVATAKAVLSEAEHAELRKTFDAAWTQA